MKIKKYIIVAIFLLIKEKKTAKKRLTKQEKQDIISPLSNNEDIKEE